MSRTTGGYQLLGTPVSPDSSLLVLVTATHEVPGAATEAISFADGGALALLVTLWERHHGEDHERAAKHRNVLGS